MSDSERRVTLDAARDALLAAFPSAWAIYVYGSFARSDDISSSDIDLALLLPPDEHIGDLLGLLSDLSAHVHREVDLVDLRRSSDVLRREVLADGLQIYVARPDEVLEWEGMALSRYQRYREEVRDLLDDFRKTGIGYGA
jgi:predicted nucleotidyltransferase